MVGCMCRLYVVGCMCMLYVGGCMCRLYVVGCMCVTSKYERTGVITF